METTTLIVNDAFAGRRKVTPTVEATGLFDRILSSDNGIEALSQLRNHAVDLIFYNWGLSPAGDAVALLKRLHKRETWGDIPVVLFTDDSNVEKRILALENGASDCLDYRTSVGELRARGQRFLRFKQRTDKLRQRNEELSQMAITDKLTGLFNRSYFDACLASEIARSRRTGSAFSLLILDLDHFKSVNDTYGHPTGDAVLSSVADLLKESNRESNTVCRYGGEEFAIILRDTPVANAYHFAERMRRRIAGFSLSARGGNFSISASIGISGSAGRETGSPRQVVEEADCALYAGKRNGRNRTEIFESPDPTSPKGDFPAHLCTAVGHA